MKGDIISESPAEIWAVLIFAGIVAATIILLRATYIDYSAFLQTPPEKLEAIEAANAIKSCFEDGKAYVTEDFLTNYDGDDVNDLCGFDKPNAEATIYDIENSRKWKFDANVNKPTHAVWIPIAYQSFDEMRDMEYELKGEYVIIAKWFGTGGIGIPANDVMLELYPSGLYLGDEGKIEKVDPNKIVGWIEKMPDNKKKPT